jgi:hypothetical protein
MHFLKSVLSHSLKSAFNAGRKKKSFFSKTAAQTERQGLTRLNVRISPLPIYLLMRAMAS